MAAISERIRTLKDLHQDPSCLIPSKLFEFMEPSNVGVSPIKMELGKFEEEYQPDLAMIVFEKDGIGNEGIDANDKNSWLKALKHAKQTSIEQGIMGPLDRPLILFAADQIEPDGVFIEIYLQALSLRNRGIGRDFYKNLARILAASNYRYWGGNANKDNIEIFRRFGSYSTSQLKEGVNLQFINNQSDFSTIRFIDRDLEREWVSTEFLKR